MASIAPSLQALVSRAFPRRAPLLRRRLLPGVVIGSLGLTVLYSGAGLAPVQAQDRVPIEAVRAINVARTYAVRLNGGLQRYRPAQCMFATAAPTNPCLLRQDDDGFLFRFAGGPPGWEERDEQPSQETELRISPDGRDVERVVYNGPFR
ncbi:hypothetical protein [Cyanobium sp. NIES-981]|uniref:hypothetical protein n=1 Tax=Cyanobium sp. NIES-981 TaxID=1851505 RepID=UPI0007DD1415|nr:hypothetical protein [Cyanobium sp. NIES-981]SBO42267.1 conserved protein of unknown function [Cyanobium sp. NIES-981]